MVPKLRLVHKKGYKIKLYITMFLVLLKIKKILLKTYNIGIGDLFNRIRTCFIVIITIIILISIFLFLPNIKMTKKLFICRLVYIDFFWKCS